MEYRTKSIRPFLGAKNFQESSSFYRDIGFKEVILEGMSYFETGDFGFYLQDAYVKDWIDNTMVFMEVVDVDRHWNDLVALDITSKYKTSKLTPIRVYPWGRECFLHDPSGILWHFGEFNLK